MKVSFIIPLYNCVDLSRQAVATLQHTLPARLAYEVILIDNASTDGTRDWLASLPGGIRVVRNDENLGYARANNQGAALARGDLLCLINNDLIFRRRWLQPMLRLHARLGARAGAIGNVQRRVSDRGIDHTGISLNPAGKLYHETWRPPWPLQWRRAGAVTGACLLIRRETFLRLGGFDETYVNGCEDVDFCLRLAQLGLVNAVALRSIILHHVSASPGRKAHDEANSLRLATKWRHELSLLAWRPWCWRELERQWRTGARDPADWPVGAALLADALHLSRRPCAAAARGLAGLMDAEFKHWARVVPGAQDPPRFLPSAQSIAGRPLNPAPAQPPHQRHLPSV